MKQPTTPPSAPSLDLKDNDPIRLKHSGEWVPTKVLWCALDFAGIGGEGMETFVVDLADDDHLALIAPPF